MSSADTALAVADAAATVRRPGRLWLTGLAAALLWAAVGGLTLSWPNQEVGFKEWGYTREFGLAAVAWAVLLAVVALSCAVTHGKLGQAKAVARAGTSFTPGSWLRIAAQRLQRAGPWLVLLAVLVGIWEVVTAKLALLPSPFFAPPQSLIEIYVGDWKRLLDSLVNSLWLLANGYVLGAISGFVTGVAIGWSRGLGYWVHPVLRFLGPVPSTALLPMAFFFFPSSWAAAVFLIALATWFPVTVLTWSGVASVNRAFYDVARTLGANGRFLIFRVAVPAALPHVFVGLFMGLGASFSVLVAAEMMGVKSGLGFYLSWAQGWASYANMYGALIVMALTFSGLITLLFAVRDRVLAWQKGVVKW
ncbi:MULTISPECIES: ABC transporter permease [unclassified Achromobacter]|uniref:ABC transporter permease n=1 Tax=unclassified Achromobacter TaxID=2626865 RepID=UPI000B51A2D2|nr:MULTISPECIES: ABC transporter permease subunit [unclassified Achromobacter]OWT72813.1 sulfonate ABC transporter permease [Achromobacter sp. HZ34]OWT74032.1 sulfonate ABC transporter permease [Achromobacter sp. HZ28]